MGGYGVRLHGEVERFRAWLERTGLECVTTWTAADLLPTDHPQNIGIVGVSGQRGANKAVHACEYLLVLGSSMSIPQTSTVKSIRATTMVVHGERLKEFLDGPPEMDSVPWASEYKALNPAPLVGSYAFNDRMTRLLPSGSVMVVDGGGTTLYTGFQSSHIREGSRLICSSAISAMGSGLPEAVGACLASGKLTSCLIGDGSLMLNLQELATIAHHKLPIKIFVLCNGGYLAIRHTQSGFMDGRFYGVDEKDLSFPDFRMIAKAFGIPYFKADQLEEVLAGEGPALCEVQTPRDQKMVRQAFKQEGVRFIAQSLEEMEYQ